MSNDGPAVTYVVERVKLKAPKDAGRGLKSCDLVVGRRETPAITHDRRPALRAVDDRKAPPRIHVLHSPFSAARWR